MSLAVSVIEHSPEPLQPLGLVPFERLMLADDSLAYPMLFVFEYRFAGQVDRTAWQKAWEGALARHPLLTGLVDKCKNHWHWPTNAELPYFHWIESETLEPEDFCSRLDLSIEPGLRGWLRQTPTEARFSCLFHHACCDGMGTLGFFQDMFSLYAQLVAANPEPQRELRPLDRARLTKRATFGLTPPPLRQQIKDTLCGASETWKFLRPTLQRLAPTGKAVTSAAMPKFRAGFDTVEFDAATMQRLKQVASSAGGTLNDLLLRDLFLVLQAWSERHDKSIAQQPVRIMMPCNLRLADDATMPATNVISYAFLTRTVGATPHAMELMEGIRDETKLIRDLRLALYFAGALGTAVAIPFGMQTILSPRFCMATAYLSNLGDIAKIFMPQSPREAGKLVIGNLLLTDMTVVPPVRQHTRVGIVVVNYGGKLKFCAKLDPHLFTTADREEFLQLFAERLTASAGLA